MRVLAVKRYSGDDRAGSMERQHADLSRWVEQTPGVIMADGPGGGWVADETVSGAVNLDRRRSLGQWLVEPLLDRWDIMIVTTQDRITRDDLHWWPFVGKLNEWGKRLVVLDDPSIDLFTPNGRLIAGVKASQAANYRLDVQRKILAARASFREQRRWAGGHWPYGYRAVPHDSGEGWVLVPDPDTSKLVKEATDRLIGGDSLRAITRDWNTRGIPTGRDHQTLTRPLNPGETRRNPRGYRWNEISLKRILQNPAVLGYATHNGAIIREDGIPTRWSDPIITPGEYHAVGEIIAGRGAPRRGIRSNRSPLLGVVYCLCGNPMHFLHNGEYRYYRCATSWLRQVTVRWSDVQTREEHSGTEKRGPCRHAASWPYHRLQNLLEEWFLLELGDVEIMLREFVPGENHETEIRSLQEAIEYLSGNLANLPPGSRAANTIITKISEHESTLDRLESQPGTPASYRYIPTGQTYGEKWKETTDWNDRGAWLLRSGIRVEFGGGVTTGFQGIWPSGFRRNPDVWVNSSSGRSCFEET